MRAAEVALTEQDRATLRSWLASGKTERRVAFRAEVVLALAEGLSNGTVAERLGTRAATVSKWRGRFAYKGLSGLSDAPRSGKPRHYAAEDERRVLAALDTPPPSGYARWDGTLLARELGDISKHQIWRVLRRHKISLARRRSWCISTDPAFAQKAADVVGLYLQPPENAVLLSVDEKPHIQALERAQGWLKLPNGKALTGFNHEYKRHGTTTLFAALEVATGLIKTGHYRRRRRVEFLDFMNRVICRASRPRDPCHPGQSEHPQTQTRPLVGPTQERAFSLHADPCLLAEPGGNLVLHPLRQGAGRRQFHLAPTGPRADRRLH